MTLARIRKRMKMTQQQLADAVGVSRPLISQVEAGWRKPYPKLKREIARVLGVEEEKIFK